MKKRLTTVQIGQRVYWHDPDSGTCNGPGVVTDVLIDAGEPVTDETIIRITKDDGGEAEVLIHELSHSK